MNLAHFMSFSTASSSKKLSSNLKKKKEKNRKNKIDPAIVPVPVNAHADILDSPKAKRIVSKCEKCSLSPPPQLRSGVLQRVTGMEGGGGGVSCLKESTGWLGRFFSLTSSFLLQSDPAESGCVPYRLLPSFLSVDLSRGHVE